MIRTFHPVRLPSLTPQFVAVAESVKLRDRSDIGEIAHRVIALADLG